MSVGTSPIEVVLDAVVRGATANGGRAPQDRTLMAMRTALVMMGKGLSLNDAAAGAAVNPRTLKEWRVTYPPFGVEVGRLMEINSRDRTAARLEARQERLEAEGLVLSYHRESPLVPGLAEWRMRYFGMPTPEFQIPVVMALEDLSNLYVFVLGPTGMGKDTLAGQYVSWRLAPDRTGKRCAWIMKIGEKGERRLGRLARYLTDPTVYREAPERTPGGCKPTGSLISDYGPFKWEPGMVWEDGTDADRPKWKANALYFVQSITPEADPNIQAIGLEGAFQGDRADEAVVSDLFDVENQKSPTERVNQLKWFNGILHSRLDTYGRLVVLANMLPVENNYEAILENYLDGAEVLREVTMGPTTYTKYNNGVAVVITKAIWTDPDTGEEKSYAPDRFPLEGHLVSPDETEIVTLDGVSVDEQLALGDEGWKRGRGLKETRSKDPITFKAMYQQERDPDVSLIDFTTEVFDAAHDHGRSWGEIMPHEIRLLGVDPARTYGAAWVLLCVDREEGKITVADFWWGNKLGYTGIKDKLILGPLGRFSPSWLCWEDNRDGSVLGETDVHRAITSAGVGQFKHTTGLERASVEAGPGALAAWMLAGKLKIPYATAEDRWRASEYESQLKAWDASPDRSKPGRPGHHPDDLMMATWIPWLKARTMIDAPTRGTGVVVGVPAALRAQYDRRRQEKVARAMAGKGRKADPRSVLTRGNPLDMIRSLGGED